MQSNGHRLTGQTPSTLFNSNRTGVAEVVHTGKAVCLNYDDQIYNTEKKDRLLKDERQRWRCTMPDGRIPYTRLSPPVQSPHSSDKFA
ncbi:hypothetical protein BaRGS_00024426 [Batillaria attramentaria]|uniref:Uncharacterized protein n=1 Tax=Batillaria attramentaria TaxID=370345 RepID=A0ABD0KB07_9CAEN